ILRKTYKGGGNNGLKPAPNAYHCQRRFFIKELPATSLFYITARNRSFAMISRSKRKHDFVNNLATLLLTVYRLENVRF
ncbi:hypothetical protein, partial [Erwinia amylovora]|uniref:hypothetical protein n=1 Tax=Erwinia amylovora TaxID=552 RepID=UPI001C558A45